MTQSVTTQASERLADPQFMQNVASPENASDSPPLVVRCEKWNFPVLVNGPQITTITTSIEIAIPIRDGYDNVELAGSVQK